MPCDSGVVCDANNVMLWPQGNWCSATSGIVCDMQMQWCAGPRVTDLLHQVLCVCHVLT